MISQEVFVSIGGAKFHLSPRQGEAAPWFFVIPCAEKQAGALVSVNGLSDQVYAELTRLAA